jgi:hypothetical protein
LRWHGARPGLAIDEWRETRTDGEGRRTVRRSTAAVRREAAGLTVRRHRRETPVRA